MRKTILGLLAIAAAVPAIPTAASAQDWGRGRYEREYRGDYGRGYSDRGDYDRGYQDRYAGYDRRGYYDGRQSWRGRDGRTYCRRSDGTTGLVVGGVAGALLGRSIDTGGDRAAGTLLGGAIGALLGQRVEKNGARCR